jgi:transposase, IS605 OrfB family, central region
MITYNAELKGVPEDIKLIMDLMEEYCIVVNKASKLQFEKQLNSITTLHNAFYYEMRSEHKNFPSQMIIRAEMESLASYKSIKSNKHKITKPFEKHNLSIRLDKRLYSKTDDKTKIRITTKEKKKEFQIIFYPKLQELMDKYDYVDPLLFVKNNKLMIGLTFDNKAEKQKESLCLGVDLGIRRVATCSDGRLIIDKKFNAEKRKLRYNKRQLQSKGTKSARKHLNKLKSKEKNKNKNQTHLVANEILKTNANIIALENLKGIKAKKYKTQNKNAVSQVPFFELRRVLTYKAENMGKHVCLVSPAYTSQIDNVSGIKEGSRKGCRFYAKSGLVYDADINAAINIARRSKHPISNGNFLDGQGKVKRPNAYQSLLSLLV